MSVNKARLVLRTAFQALLWCGGLAVLLQNLVLLRQNRQLRDLQLTSGTEIAVGTRLRSLVGLTLDGRLRAVTLPLAGPGLLVVTFSRGCPACRANQQGWTALARQAEERGWDVLWVSRDTVDVTRDYCLKEHIPLSAALADPPYRTYVQLALKAVPKTVVVRRDGTVDRVWRGLLDGTRWGDVFAYFGTTDPGTRRAGDAYTPPGGGCGSNPLDRSEQFCK
jgi:peroxiredoxin